MSDKGAAWTCERHGTTQPNGRSYCVPCLDAFKNRRAVAEMTVEERITALKALGGQLTIPFENLHERITELMGRDVWTHELAHPEQLCEELRNGERVGMADVIAKLPRDKPVIVIGGGE